MNALISILQGSHHDLWMIIVLDHCIYGSSTLHLSLNLFLHSWWTHICFTAFCFHEWSAQISVYFIGTLPSWQGFQIWVFTWPMPCGYNSSGYGSANGWEKKTSVRIAVGAVRLLLHYISILNNIFLIYEPAHALYILSHIYIYNQSFGCYIAILSWPSCQTSAPWVLRIDRHGQVIDALAGEPAAKAFDQEAAEGEVI